MSKLNPIPMDASWGRMIWLLDGRNNPDAQMSLARMEVNESQTSEAHMHSNCTECIHLIEGRIRQRIGDTWIVMNPGDSVHIPQNQVHQTQNISSNTATMIVSYSEPFREYTPQ